jgi:hypothetical protein
MMKWFRRSSRPKAPVRQDESLGREKHAYQSHRDELLSRNLGQYVLIKDDEVISTHDSYQSAMEAGYEKYGTADPFLVQQVSKEDMASCYLRCLECIT